jgi:hypothetical protein
MPAAWRSNRRGVEGICVWAWGAGLPGVCGGASFHYWPRRCDRLIFHLAWYNHGERPLDGSAYAPT